MYLIRTRALMTSIIFSFTYHFSLAQPDADRPKELKLTANDNLYVYNSACVGFGCVVPESFGVTTILLKEDNLRIKFDDTSVLAGFPNNDWQITINDQSSGGLNKFSIENLTAGKIPFTIEGAAPNNSLYVDSNGKIGLRTNNPVLDMSIKTGNTPAIRLEQDNSSGFTAQTWDVAGNEANFFVRDATNGSKLCLRIIPNAPANSLFIGQNGNIGNGTGNPLEPIHIEREGKAAGFLALSRNGENENFVKLESGSQANAILFDHKTSLFLAGSGNKAANWSMAENALVIKGQTENADGLVGVGTANPTQKLDVKGLVKSEGNLIATDERLMTVQGPFEDGLTAALKLNPVIMQANGRGGTRDGLLSVGVIAQNLAEVSPLLVSQYTYTSSPEGLVDIDKNPQSIQADEYLLIRDHEIQYILLNAIKEQQKLIEQLQKEVEMLKKANIQLTVISPVQNKQDVHEQE